MVSPEQPIEALLVQSRDQIRDIMAKPFADEDSLLPGALSLAQSRFTDHILTSFRNGDDGGAVANAVAGNGRSVLGSGTVSNGVDGASQPGFQGAQDREMSPGEVLDQIWVTIHHPAIKAFQNRFWNLSKDARRRKQGNRNTRAAPVEIRKLFDDFVKFIGRCFDFYLQLLKTLVSRYDLSVYIPVRKLCLTLKEDDLLASVKPGDQLAPTPEQVPRLVYVVHKCVLYIGDLSRYRTLVAKTYLPSTAISKEDNNNYSKSIELYKLSLLILPSLGDPYNHIAIIDNVKDDRFNVVYNFVRSSLTSSPLQVGFTNLLNLLAKQPRTNSILKKFESHNALDRSTITKNDRLELLKSQFLILLNYYLLPSKWKAKEGYLVKGYSIAEIENDFYRLLGRLDFHKQIFNDFYFKQLVILTGGFEMLIDPKMSHPDLKQTREVVSDYLDFLFRYLLTFLKVVLLNWKKDASSANISTSLLPVVRLMLCWLKERQLPRGYLLTNEPCTNALAEIVNKIAVYYKENRDVFGELETFKGSLPADVFSKKPTRRRLFKEDVTLKEFQPINLRLADFDDDHLYRKDEAAVLALIGELPNESHKSMKLNDNLLRLVAIGVLGKDLVAQNGIGIDFDDNTGLFKTKGTTNLELGSLPNHPQPKPRELLSASSSSSSSSTSPQRASAPVKRPLQKTPAVPMSAAIAAATGTGPAAANGANGAVPVAVNSANNKQRTVDDVSGLEDALLAAEARRREVVPDVNKYVDMVASLVGDKPVASAARRPSAAPSSASSSSSLSIAPPPSQSRSGSAVGRAAPVPSDPSVSSTPKSATSSNGSAAVPLLSNSIWSSNKSGSSASLGKNNGNGQTAQKPLQMNPLLFQYDMSYSPYSNSPTGQSPSPYVPQGQVLPGQQQQSHQPPGQQQPQQQPQQQTYFTNGVQPLNNMNMAVNSMMMGSPHPQMNPLGGLGQPLFENGQDRRQSQSYFQNDGSSARYNSAF